MKIYSILSGLFLAVFSLFGQADTTAVLDAGKPEPIASVQPAGTQTMQGNQHQHQHRFVDEDGDGLNDLMSNSRSRGEYSAACQNTAANQNRNAHARQHGNQTGMQARGTCQGKVGGKRLGRK